MAESNTIIFKDFQACRSGLEIFDSTVYFINTHVNSSLFFFMNIYSIQIQKKPLVVFVAQNIFLDTMLK